MGIEAHEPERIERLGETTLKISWKDGHESHYTWTGLRAACPCAACREATAPIPDAAEVRPLEIQPVGRYAIHIRFNDGHGTGIFSYEYLRSLCNCEACQPRQLEEG